MKKLLTLFLALLFITSTMPVYGQYSSQAYGGNKDETTFNRITDWFATVGKSQEEKYLIKHKRRTARKISRAKKRIAKQKRDFAKKRKALKR